MVIMLKMTAETKSQDNKKQGWKQRRSQFGNKIWIILGGNDPQQKFNRDNILKLLKTTPIVVYPGILSPSKYFSWQKVFGNFTNKLMYFGRLL